MAIVAREENSGRLVVYDREMHLVAYEEPAVGDTFEVIRGNGMREGHPMGTATVTGFKNRCPMLDIEWTVDA